MGCGSSTHTSAASLRQSLPQLKSPGEEPVSDQNNCAMEEAAEPQGGARSIEGGAKPADINSQIVPRDRVVNKYMSTAAKKELVNTDINELLIQTEKRVIALSQVTDFSWEAAMDDLMYIRTITSSIIPNEKKEVIRESLSKLGFAKIFKRIWAQGFGDQIFNDENKIARLNMKYAMITLWNSTDKSQKLCKDCMECQLYVDILKYLRSPALDPNDTDNEAGIYFIKGLMGIIHNIVQVPELEAREFYRESGAFETMNKLHNSSNLMVRCKSELLLAYIINEDENELVNSEESSFRFLLEILENALKYKDRQSKKWGFQAVELIMGLNRLAANDANKVRIVKQGALPYYVKMLQPECTTNEQMNAARGLWILAFKCREEIQKEVGCLEALQNLADTTQDEGVRKQAKGALWILSGRDKDGPDLECDSRESMKKKKKSSSAYATATGPGETKPASQQHIMISYQWQYKPIMLRIRDQLRDAGYRVWMDVDNMSGSILEAMALAVEKAAVVIVCLSQKYKESPSCRTEAEYTFRLRKDIIPLLLQPKYRPDGWLGALTGNKLYFDFSKDEKFSASIGALVKELGDRGRGEDVLDQVDASPDFSVEAPPSLGTGPPGGHNLNDVYGWTNLEVDKWLLRIGLEKQQKWFDGFDGSLLVEYKSMQREAPEFFYTTLRDDMRFPLLDILKFTKGLKHL